MTGVYGNCRVRSESIIVYRLRTRLIHTWRNKS